MQRRLDPETGVNKPFESVLCLGRIQNLFEGGAPIFVTFSGVVFSAGLFLNNFSNKTAFKGVRRHASPEKFRKFTYCNGHFSAS